MNAAALPLPAPTLAQRWRVRLPGLLLTAAVATAAMGLATQPWLQTHGISALTLAIVLGIALGNTLYPRLAARAGAGVGFSKQWLLRAGIVLYGLRLTFQDIGQVGVAGVLIDALVLASTFALAWWAGTRWFGMDRNSALLIGAGSSICGAAAVMAAEPVVSGRAEQVTVAVSTVVVFGTLAMFLYPMLYQLNAAHGWIPISAQAYGVFTGSTVHEVAQVVAAGRAVSETAADTAVIAKMVRVMMLAPFLVALSLLLARGAAARAGAARAKIVVPWFAFGFVAVAGLNSLQLLPAALVAQAVAVDTALLAMAMAALGLTTHVSALRQAGIRPLLLALLLFGWLLAGGLGINVGVHALLG
ncbi:YeiH family protein [Stenotrophomonas rhizophila]|uniref:YeiH family protein n=1 Tax=Stenotrophomonas rhizophila TaxID=216778 RepID=UPI001E36E3FD|nr:YeiH family protein [Stenotrophomonas rhizophila]MCC7633566.1 YeiH family putative sulfate export transporter [Stenotrophomonas rhizophila]MCC7662949.1 YeiH family putative sulfate export transporter [Stenotrophomonas rhizophila]